MSSDEEFLAAARRRFYALAGMPEPPKKQHPKLVAWASYPGPEAATAEFIRQNQERINRGQLPINSAGQPVAPEPAAPAEPDHNPYMEAFDSTPDPAYGNIKVKRFNS
jgi:hypothetical protein